MEHSKRQFFGKVVGTELDNEQAHLVGGGAPKGSSNTNVSTELSYPNGTGTCDAEKDWVIVL